jgi:energy-converting hydrogenase Eha subunit C
MPMKELLPMWAQFSEGSLALLTSAGYLEVAILYGLGTCSIDFG